MEPSILTRVISQNGCHIWIEVVQMRPEWPEPHKMQMALVHHGKPEETVKNFHDMISLWLK
jgi:hypothetical protein